MAQAVKGARPTRAAACPADARRRQAASTSSPARCSIEGERITQVSPSSVPPDAVVIDLGELTLLPGLMDMEINMLMGGPSGGNRRADVQDDPAFKTLRGHRQLPHHAAGRLHHRPQPRAVRADRWGAARRRALRGRSTWAGSRARGSCRPGMRSRPPAGISTRRCSSGWARASCRSASKKASPTGCPRSAKPCVTS